MRRVNKANPARPDEKVCETTKLLCSFGVEYRTFELPIIRLIASRVTEKDEINPSFLLFLETYIQIINFIFYSS